MSENNLQARNRYIAKIQKKADELAQSIRLLTQVDDKLFKQSGGGLGTLGVNIAELGARAQAWQKAIGNTEELNIALKSLTQQIDDYQNMTSLMISAIGIPSSKGIDFDNLKNLLEGLNEDTIQLITGKFAEIMDDPDKEVLDVITTEINKDIDNNKMINENRKQEIKTSLINVVKTKIEQIKKEAKAQEQPVQTQ
jgi:hypothetical protein